MESIPFCVIKTPRSLITSCSWQRREEEYIREVDPFETRDTVIVMNFYLLPAASYQTQQKIKEQAAGRRRVKKSKRSGSHSESTALITLDDLQVYTLNTSTISATSSKSSRDYTYAALLRKTSFDRESLKKSATNTEQESVYSLELSKGRKTSLFNYSSNVELADAIKGGRVRQKHKKHDNQSDRESMRTENSGCENSQTQEEENISGEPLTRVYSDVSSIFSTKTESPKTLSPSRFARLKSKFGRD